MPLRQEPIVNNNIYHIFNKTIESKEIFANKELCSHFLDLIRFYRSIKHRIKYSDFKRLDLSLQNNILKTKNIKKYFRINIYCYNLMPNHFHFLLRQKTDNGISKSIADVINSFTKYYNLKNKRLGPIFLTRFKCVRIQSREQLIHVSRYIHLNQYSSGVLNSFKESMIYPWSSLHEYVNINKNNICETNFILKLFNNKKQNYLKFIQDNLEYQKSLEIIKRQIKFD
jgi:putative transposase